ncbi:hypothetical protein ACFX2K_001577 [Malus domestica]
MAVSFCSSASSSAFGQTPLLCGTHQTQASSLPPSSSSLVKTLIPNPKVKTQQRANARNSERLHCSDGSLISTPTLDSDCESVFQTERGLKFDVGGTFFRHESATGRDLGVLAASLYKKSKGKLRVLDALCGCGIRSVRYLVEAEADFVLANDANDENKKVITENLSQVESGSGGEARWEVSLTDANRIMTECYLKRDFFDLIDIDSFGSDSSFLRSAFNALKLNGLLYVTSTDGFSSGGRRPQQTLAAYGAYVRPMPYSNELGLGMLIGGAVREASVLGYRVTPLFSYYSYHGPIFRVMLRVNRGKLPDNKVRGCNRYGRTLHKISSI